MDEKIDLKLPQRDKRSGGSSGKFSYLLLAVLLVNSVLLLFILFSNGRFSISSRISKERLENVALKLEKDGLYRQAVDKWKEYINVVKPEGSERAKVWYRIGKLYQSAGDYGEAVSAFYTSEEAAKVDEISQEIARRTTDCLEKMGRFSAMNYELKRRTSFNPQDTSAAGEVVAEIGSNKITKADLDNMIEAEVETELSQVAGSLLPEQLREQKKKLLDDIFKKGQRGEWLQRLIAEELLYRRAREEKLQDQDNVKILLSSVERKILAERYLDSEYQKRIHIIPDDLKGYYEVHKDDFKKNGKVRSFDDVKDEIYRIVRSNREKEAQKAIMGELMDRYDVVIHQRALETGIERGSSEQSGRENRFKGGTKSGGKASAGKNK